MPPKLTVNQLAEQLADLKKKLDNGGAAADAADANAETDVDGDPQAKPVAGSEETILKSLTTGFEEVMPLMGGWLKRKGSFYVILWTSVSGEAVATDDRPWWSRCVEAHVTQIRVTLGELRDSDV